MFPTLSNTARAVTFYLLALGLCAALCLFVPSGWPIGLTVMLTPALSVLLMQLVVTRDGWRRSGWAKLGMGRLGTRVWGIAVGLPLAILLLSETVVRVTDGYLAEGNRWIIVPGFLAVMTCAGQIYGWLREVTGSVYPAVLTHTAFNFGLSVAVLCTTTPVPTRWPQWAGRRAS